MMEWNQIKAVLVQYNENTTGDIRWAAT